MAAMSATGKPSTALRRKAWRGSGVIDSSLWSAGVGALVWISGLRLTPTEFHRPVKVRNRATLGSIFEFEQRGVLDQHFKRGGDIGIAGSLVARKRAGKPPQVRKMRRNGL